jgi:hypothetical protein
MSLMELLEEFRRSNKFTTRGKLGVALVLTRRALEVGLPLNQGSLLTSGGGQVAGLSGAAVAKILKEHGVSRSLGTEVGRTSRGTPEAARSYADWLNQQTALKHDELHAIESWWVLRVQEFLAARPFKISFDDSQTLQTALRAILLEAQKRQREAGGAMHVGVVLQHLIGAKLDLAMPDLKLEHHGASVADGVSSRRGDFQVGDVVIHCTTAPTEALLRKCRNNIDQGLRPMILTIDRGLAAAESLAEPAGLSGRVEVMDALQFLAANLYEMSRFSGAKRRETVGRLLERYNSIIEGVETDQSLKVEIG